MSVAGPPEDATETSIVVDQTLVDGQREDASAEAQLAPSLQAQPTEDLAAE
jgi:hypothetical protein